MNVFTMPGVAEMGMVWMGSGQNTSDMSLGIMPSENCDLLMDHDSPYYTSSHHSASNQSLDDMHNIHHSPMAQLEGLDMLQMADSNDSSSYIEDDDSQQVYMINTATQTIPCPTRKIKPVKHPGLVLKTPIAYQSNTDPSVIPIQKDGMAVCQKCGAIGVKHAFYTRERRFCSIACSRADSGLPPTLPNSNSPTNRTYADHSFKMEYDDELLGLVSDQPLPQLPAPLPPAQLAPLDDSLPLLVVRRKHAELANSYDWDGQLSTGGTGGTSTTDDRFHAAPVTCFREGVPMTEVWSRVQPGMKVEVENTDCDQVSEACPDSFWVATVVRIVGYKALLRYEGFGQNSSKDFWVSLCSNQVHPVGWCATRGKPLIPPKTIENKYSDWKDFLRKRLTGARTLPSNYGIKVTDSLRCRFQCGVHLEVVDKNRISQVKVAIVHRIVGKRLNVKYYDLPPDDAGFWCHEDSALLHPVGWAKKVGHNLVAPPNYLERISSGLLDENHATDELFNPIQVGVNDSVGNFVVGMKLEAIDPLNLSSICAATVMDVLHYGYIMIRIDMYETDLQAVGADWFCYHRDSPCIFPVGFCELNNIPLTPPKGYNPQTFTWSDYLAETGYVPVPVDSFPQYVPTHGFLEGMRIEAADLMDPRLVCVATVARIVGRLLKVHFDGWEDEYDQWLDCDSPDIYPVGWCFSVGHKLEGPRVVPKATGKVTSPPKGMKKRGRKKKSSIQSPSTNSSSFQSKQHQVVRVSKSVGSDELVNVMDQLDEMVTETQETNLEKQTTNLERSNSERQATNLERQATNNERQMANSERYVAYTERQLINMERQRSNLQRQESNMQRQESNLQRQGLNNMEESEIDNSCDLVGENTYANCDNPPVLEPENIVLSQRLIQLNAERQSQALLTQRQLQQQLQLQQQQQQQCLQLEKESVDSDDGDENSSTTSSLVTTSVTTTQGMNNVPRATPPMIVERKATSYVNACHSDSSSQKVIPRIIDNTGTATDTITPNLWNVFDVAQFLRVNDCANYCDTFSKQKVDGVQLLNLNKEDILEYTGGKVGPSLKIYDLIQQLKMKINPSQSRHMNHMKANIKKFL